MPKKDTPEVVKPTAIEPAKLTDTAVTLFAKYTENLVILIQAEETHDTTAKDIIDMYEELRTTMVAAGMPKKDTPMSIFESLRIILDSDENLSEPVVKRAKKELLHITQYFQMGLEIRIRDIRFTLFGKVVALAHTGDISKASIKTALKKKDDAYVKALEALVTKAEFAKLVGSINMALIPQNIQDMVNNIADVDSLREIGKLIKVQSQKVA